MEFSKGDRIAAFVGIALGTAYLAQAEDNAISIPTLNCDELEEITFYDPADPDEYIHPAVFHNFENGHSTPHCDLMVDFPATKRSTRSFYLNNLGALELNQLLLDAALNEGRLSIDEVLDFALSRGNSSLGHYCSDEHLRTVTIRPSGEVFLHEYREYEDGGYPVVPKANIWITYQLPDGVTVSKIRVWDQRSEDYDDHSKSEVFFNNPIAVDFESWLTCEGDQFTTCEMLEDPMLPFNQ
jgi:hypothetical protein